MAWLAAFRELAKRLLVPPERPYDDSWLQPLKDLTNEVRAEKEALQAENARLKAELKVLRAKKELLLARRDELRGES